MHSTAELFGDGATSAVGQHPPPNVGTRVASSYRAHTRPEIPPQSYEIRRNENGLGSDEDESSSDGDCNGDIHPELDYKLFKTVMLLKAKDPSIYNPVETFFSEEDRRLLVEGNSHQSECEEPVEHVDADSREDPKNHPSRLERPCNGKADDKHALARTRGETPGVALGARRKENKRGQLDEKPESRQGPQDMEGDHQARLERRFFQDIEGSRSVQTSLVNEMTKDDRFLMNYVFNNGWQKGPNTLGDVDFDLDVEAEMEANAEDFEEKYNLRFESPEARVLNTRPREITESLRRSDTRRHDRRVRQKERKAAAKKDKMEVIGRLQQAKKAEFQERLEKLSKIGGLQNSALEAFLSEQLDGNEDWDAEKFDARMARVFGDAYYAEEDRDNGDGGVVEGKHVESPSGEAVARCSLAGEGSLPGGMIGKGSADVKKVGIEEGDQPVARGLGEKQATNGIGQEAIREKLEKSFMESLYSMEFTDLVGDMPVRFKYRNVKPESYGLSSKEILEASDEDLDHHVPIEKLSAYVPEGAQRVDGRIARKNAWAFRRRMKEKKLQGCEQKKGGSVGKSTHDHLRCKMKKEEAVDPGEDPDKGRGASFPRKKRPRRHHREKPPSLERGNKR